MSDDVGVHVLGQDESDRYTFGESVGIGVWNVRQPGRVREAHEDLCRGLLEMLSARQVGRRGCGCEGPVQQGALAVGRANAWMLPEDLSEGRQDLIAEVQKGLVCRQWHKVLLSDALIGLSQYMPVGRFGRPGQLLLVPRCGAIGELKRQVSLEIYDRLGGGNRIRASGFKPCRVKGATWHGSPHRA